MIVSFVVMNLYMYIFNKKGSHNISKFFLKIVYDNL